MEVGLGSDDEESSKGDKSLSKGELRGCSEALLAGPAMAGLAAATFSEL